MPNYLRSRYGGVAIIYRIVTITDSRGNKTQQPTAVNPHRVMAHASADRSSRAEVPGEQEVDVITLRVPFQLSDVGLRSRVEWDGGWWDVVAPPADRHGIKRVRHTTLVLRRRPDRGALIV